MKQGWELKDFEGCIERIPRTTKIPKKQFLAEGKYPIISQENDYINGYWDKSEDLLKVDRPLVIFGDHTKKLKYIDFDFVLGADGVKVLLPIKTIDARFFYYQLQSIALGDLGYARHYRLLKQERIVIPSLEEQKQIVAKLDLCFEAIDKARANATKNLENAKELFQSKLNDIFSQKGEGWVDKKLSDVCENLDSKRIPITKNKRTEGNIPYYGASGVVDHVNEYIFNEDLLLVSEDGANLLARTYPIAFSISGKTWVNNHAHVLKFQSMAAQRFIEYYLNSIKLDDYVSGMAQPKLNQRMINSISVPNADEHIQKDVVSRLDELKEQTQSLESKYQQELNSLRELKKSILQKAFVGELY